MEALSKILRISLALTLLLVGTSLLAQEEAPKLVTFKIRNAGVNVSGTFDSYEVKGQFDENDLGHSRFEVSIDVSTIDTGIGARDKHLKKAKYFDVENYPQITFKSTGFLKTDTGYIVKGQLTIKATTREVKMSFQSVKQDSGTMVLKGELTLDRRDYGVGKNHLILGDEVRIAVNYEYQPKGS